MKLVPNDSGVWQAAAASTTEPDGEQASAARARREARGDFERARMAADLGKHRTALTLLERCLKCEPDHPEYLGLFGYCLAHESAPRARALAACQRAVETRSYDAHLHAQLGYVYSAAGMSSRARQCYETALGLDPHEPLAQRELPRLAAPRRGWRRLLHFRRKP